jgi:hypothetical protein
MKRAFSAGAGGCECLSSGASCVDGCGYRRWVLSGGFKRLAPADSAFSLAESYRLLLVDGTDLNTASRVLVRSGTFRRSVSAVDPVRGCVSDLASFLRLLQHLGRAPWASSTFSTNERMVRRLCAAHLPLIVGSSAAEEHREQLVSFLDTGNCVGDARNTVWITNRQQGKTSTLGKFIAALAIFSPSGGLVATVYSTGLDRAVELVKAAKQYINWMRSESGRMVGHDKIVYTRDNERSFTLRTQAGVENEIAARPRNVDSCRGDAPRCAFFDEAAFMSATFWYQFAYPLLQVKNRIFTCTTTPPPQDNYFADFARSVKKENARGNNFFFLINHALACEACIDAGVAEDCTHQLHLIPPWKSLLRMTHMASLVPAGRRKEFEAEVYGVCHATDGFYFEMPLLEAMRDRAPVVRPSLLENTVYVAMDPASHQKSEMALVALGLSSTTGQTVVLGLASVGVARYETYNVQAVVRIFTERLLAATTYLGSGRAFIPIVECNNNEVLSSSMLSVFNRVVESGRCRAVMPFTTSRFSKDITPGVGVWTRDTNKLAGVQEVQTLLLEGRLVLSQNMVTVTRDCVGNRTGGMLNPRVAVRTLVEQLGRVKDDEKGRISGKTSHGDEDDMAIALIFGVYWSTAVRLSNA